MNRTPRTRALRAVGVVASLAGLITAAACGSDSSEEKVAETALFKTLPEKIQKSGTLTLGALWETPPVISVTADDTSKPVGIAPDLAEVLGAELGVKVEWKNMQWPAQLPGVQSGVVDALFGQVSVTAEREQSVVDLVPFSKSVMGLVLKADQAKGVDSLADMCGQTIAVPVGSTQAVEVKAASKRFCADNAIELDEFQGATHAVNALKSGSVDAWFDNHENLVQVAAADAKLAAVKLPEDEVAPLYNAIAVAKKQAELAEALTKAMKTILENGDYEKVLASYDAAGVALTSADVVINPITKTPAGSTK